MITIKDKRKSTQLKIVERTKSEKRSEKHIGNNSCSNENKIKAKKQNR
jgi:hypothetical protein